NGLGDYQVGNVTISRVYYVEGLGHNLFSVGQFCDSDLEVAFRQHTCFVRNLEGVDLLTGSQGNNLYTLSLQDIMASSPICLLSKASKTKSWLWHRHLSHLNFGAINHLARQGLVRGLPKLNVNGKKYILVIVDDYSRFTWVKFLRLKDETPMFIIKFLKMIQVRLNDPIRRIRIDNGTEFVNQTLRDYYKEVGISHETSVARSPQQNGVVERRNRTLIEAACTIIRDDYQEYRLHIPDMMLNDMIKQSESYQMFLKYSIGQISPKIRKEFKPKLAKKKTGSRSTRGVVIHDPTCSLKLKPVTSKLKLKGVQSLTLEDKKLQKLCKLSKKARKPTKNSQVLEAQVMELVRNLGFSMSSQSSLLPQVKDVVINQGFPMRKRLFLKRMLFLNGGQIMKVNTLMILNSILMSKRRKIMMVMLMMKAMIILVTFKIQDTDDEVAETKSDVDEIYKYKIHVRKDVDV
nr:putative ribonuclease H-like domain-containing protein [Tanacetum cinerariifolium]